MPIPATGPIQIYVGQNTLLPNGSIQLATIGTYLGSGETGPDIDMFELWSPVFTDQGGTEEPSELLFQGSHAVSRMTLTKWVYATLSSLTADISGHSSFNMGRAMSGVSFTVWYLATGPGRDFTVLRFLNSRLQPTVSRATGSRPNKMQLTFQHRRFWNPANCSWTVWDNVAGIGLNACA